jgi:hypothetical protein
MIVLMSMLFLILACTMIRLLSMISMTVSPMIAIANTHLRFLLVSLVLAARRSPQLRPGMCTPAVNRSIEPVLHLFMLHKVL